MFGFGAISELPFSTADTAAKLGSADLNTSGSFSADGTVTKLANVSISASGTIAANPKLTIKDVSALSSTTTVSAAGIVTKLGSADLNTSGSFTSGFTQGFDRGSFVSGRPFISQNHLDSHATLVADGTVERIGGPVSMLGTATFTADYDRVFPLFANIQSIGSLTGNSVLLHGGSVSLNPVVSLQAIISTDYDNPDIVAFTLYIDKLRGIDGYISKTKNITGYIDKQLNITANVDKTSGITGYIDKVVEKTLVRER